MRELREAKTELAANLNQARAAAKFKAPGIDDLSCVSASKPVDVEEVASRVIVDLDETGARPGAATEHHAVLVQVLLQSR